jgi:DNA-binding CsgD family transcriptional regulator
MHALGERVKELNCLYGIAQLVERHPASLEDILAGAVLALPPAWQYPEITCARIVFLGKRYESRGYVQSAWRQFTPIRVSGETVGEVSVCYREERPLSFEGPFLREERTLINAVAEYLGAIVRRIAAERELHDTNRQLTVERETLKEANAALRTVLARIDEEKRELRREINANVEKILLPILNAVSLALPPSKRSYADLMRRSLLDITAPFTHRLSIAFDALTPTEVSVCHMIRSGLRTKEIAGLRGVSAATVNRHREHIRRKLGLTNRTANLITYLQGNVS